MDAARQRRTVLLVEDDRRHRKSLQRHLEKLDFSVIEPFTAAGFLSTVSALLKTSMESG
jgi:ActR/RegA family two-component response regulator